MIVRSSTSNSDQGLPAGKWGKVWLLAVGLVVLTLAGLEVFWRLNEYSPSVNDSEDLWASVRHQVAPASIVLLGTSRIKSNVDSDWFASEVGGMPPLQLGIMGGSPVPVLEDLADDPAFAGIAIVEVFQKWVFNWDSPEGKSAPAAEQTARSYLNAYSTFRVSPAKRWEAALRVRLQSFLVMANPSRVTPKEMLKALWQGEFPEVRFRVFPNRHFRLEKHYDPPAQPAPDSAIPSAITDAAFARLAKAVTKLQARGGRVIFVLLPTTGNERRGEDRFPRPHFWNRLGPQTKALTIHCDDYPELLRYATPDGKHFPDGEHLYTDDVPEFTRTFARIVKSKLAGASRNGVGKAKN